MVERITTNDRAVDGRKSVETVPIRSIELEPAQLG